MLITELGRHTVVQHDNDHKHTSKMMTKFLSDKKEPVIMRPDKEQHAPGLMSYGDIYVTVYVTTCIFSSVQVEICEIS
ncbi:Hypothetical predicted protein [Octopus vulgaris]|uniref:Uncharacterized protein n=1 Tax=Octopus vulgaris TaxID=6645 RepID=A0AA36B1Y6_OCTVU|nr:Hypothetical predicted protein [Octopus vulgaris]